MKATRGKRNGILIVGDSLPPKKTTIDKLNSVLNPRHTVTIAMQKMQEVEEVRIIEGLDK